MDNFISTSTIVINAPANKVWQTLTTPELAKQYLFGSDVTADWRVGGAITYAGMWEGKKFEDKGTILTLEPNKQLTTTHFSPLSGKEDKPENYHTVSYTLDEDAGKTTVTLTQDNNETQEEADHSTQNWNMALESLKKVVESL
ncbi:MAG TPA: SRPBCC family protein [Patescibacteria group bacterium]|nr:SRPBCC family protein [Patescibacteria group bacterium]